MDKTGSTEKTNILIVDDRADKLLAFKTVLDELDERVVLMRSGESALRWLLENDCAVILLDVNMPGLDGFETAQLIRSRTRSAHIPIIFITAHTDEVHEARGYALGAVDYILAPVAPAVLRSKVAVFVQLHKLARQIERRADERIALAREQTARAEAEHSLRGASFLADSSKLLSGSLDNIASLMRNASRLAVPMLGDFSAVALTRDTDISPRIVWAPQGDNAGESEWLAGDAAWLAAVDEVLSAGQAKFIADFPDYWQAAVPRAGGADSPEAVRAQGIRQVLLLPLAARGKIHGVLGLAVGCARKPYSDTEMALASDIAGHVAMALENCLLFREIQDANQRTHEFLATLSHELRNPLAPIRNAIYSMHLGGLWSTEGRKYKDIIERQLEHMTRLVDDLLDAARITRGRIQLRTEQLDLVEKIHRVLEAVRPALERAGHRLHVAVPSEPVWVMADRIRIQQIIENLLVNAIKYTEAPGRIEVTMGVENGEARIAIRDNGVGIAPEMMPRIWDMFVQVDDSTDRTRNGLGIGLPLAKKLVMLHGGSIECASEGLGKGSEFVVRLPVIAGARAQPAAADAAAQKPFESSIAGRILVVDDNQDSAQSLGVLLGKWGHEVELAFDGASALEVARTFRPELVFLDIGMPKMNGYEVARRLREDVKLARTRFIVLSGYGAEIDHQRSREAGFDLHLVKPVDPRKLPAMIASVLTARQRQAAH